MSKLKKFAKFLMAEPSPEQAVHLFFGGIVFGTVLGLVLFGGTL